MANANATAMRDFHPTFFAETAIGIGYGVEVNAQVDSQPAHRGKRLARRHRSFHHQRAELIHNLPVHGRRSVQVNSNLSFLTHAYAQCLLYIDSIQLLKRLSSENFAGICAEPISRSTVLKKYL